MKNKTRRISRILPAILAVMICVTAFPVTAFAGGTDPAPEPLPEAAAEFLSDDYFEAWYADTLAQLQALCG